MIAGSANNQLAEPEDAERLDAAGILYAPDYVSSAGGVIQLLGLVDHGWDEPELQRNLAAIGDTLRGLFRTADEAGITPAAAAERLAAERVAAGAGRRRQPERLATSAHTVLPSGKSVGGPASRERSHDL